MNVDQFMGHLAERYRVSEEAVRVLRRALERGGGRLAQFSHPELGGYGQWMPGMTQIGDMFNYELRDRVERLCQELTILPTVNMNPCWLLFRRACSFNKTIHDETYETHVRDETNVTDETDGAHEGARAMVAGRTRRASQLSRRSERNALCILRGSQAAGCRYGRWQSPTV